MSYTVLNMLFDELWRPRIIADCGPRFFKSPDGISDIGDGGIGICPEVLSKLSKVTDDYSPTNSWDPLSF